MGCCPGKVCGDVMLFRDQDGTEVVAVQLDAPCILNTPFGECASEPGSWVITMPTLDRPVVFADAAFRAAFTPVE